MVVGTRKLTFPSVCKLARKSAKLPPRIVLRAKDSSKDCGYTEYPVLEIKCRSLYARDGVLLIRYESGSQIVKLAVVDINDFNSGKYQVHAGKEEGGR